MVVAGPIELCPLCEKVFGGFALAAVAGAPEGAGDFSLVCNWGECFEAVYEAKGGCLPEVGGGSTLDEAAGGVPLGEGYGVGEGGAVGDDRAFGFDVGSAIEECIEDRDVVAACGPVERRFGVAAGKADVDFGSAGDEERDGLRSVGEVAGPVGGDVEWGAGSDSGGGEGGVFG